MEIALLILVAIAVVFSYNRGYKDCAKDYNKIAKVLLSLGVEVGLRDADLQTKLLNNEITEDEYQSEMIQFADEIAKRAERLIPDELEK